VTLRPQAWLPEGSEEQLRWADHPSVWASQCQGPRGGGQASHVLRGSVGCMLPSIPFGPVPWSVSEPRGEWSPSGGRKSQGPLPPAAQPLQALWQPPVLEQKVPLSQPSAGCSAETGWNEGGVFISLPSPSRATPPTGLQVLLMHWDEGKMTPTPSSPSFEKVQASESGGGAEGGSHGRCQKEGWRGHVWAVAWTGQSGLSCPAVALPK
uniref:Uncharacterized protein n=1 Tax=Rhinopithecus bieti TaxID=61621 RepID=A0A2K6JMI1_RHIBE